MRARVMRTEAVQSISLRTFTSYNSIRGCQGELLRSVYPAHVWQEIVATRTMATKRLVAEGVRAKYVFLAREQTSLVEHPRAVSWWRLVVQDMDVERRSTSHWFAQRSSSVDTISISSST